MKKLSLKNLKERFGFTLLELIITLVIVTVIAAIIVANIRVGQRQTVLKNGSELAAQAIREARTLGVGSIKLPSGQVPAAGYGVYVDARSGTNTKIMLYGDPGATSGGSVAANFDTCLAPWNKTCVKVSTLEAGTFIKSASVTAYNDSQVLVDTPVTTAYVTFAPDGHSARIYYGAGVQAGLCCAVQLKLTVSLVNEPSLQRVIVITDKGEVRVQ